MKQRIVILCSLLYLLFSGVSLIIETEAVYAQNGLTPIYSGRNLTNFYWSPDNSMLIFHERGFEAGVELENPDYFYFDVSTQTLERNTIWPLQPSLSAQEQQSYMPYIYQADSIGYANENDFMFLSPNQRYMVYVADPENPVLALADRQTVAAKIFDALAGNTLETKFFFTLWSANSQRVLVGNHPVLGDFPRYFYISDFALDVQEATIQELPVIVEFADTIYTTGRIRDINADGTLLLTGSTGEDSADGSELGPFLALFRPSDMTIQALFENAHIRQQNIIAVAFDPDDERYLLALTQEGIQRYNTLANSWSMVNAGVNATWVDSAWFSPDGRYLAVQDFTDRSNSISDIYIIDLTQVPSPAEKAGRRCCGRGLTPYPRPFPPSHIRRETHSSDAQREREKNQVTVDQFPSLGM